MSARFLGVLLSAVIVLLLSGQSPLAKKDTTSLKWIFVDAETPGAIGYVSATMVTDRVKVLLLLSAGEKKP